VRAPGARGRGRKELFSTPLLRLNPLPPSQKNNSKSPPGVAATDAAALAPSVAAGLATDASPPLPRSTLAAGALTFHVAAVGATTTTPSSSSPPPVFFLVAPLPGRGASTAGTSASAASAFLDAAIATAEASLPGKGLAGASADDAAALTAALAAAAADAATATPRLVPLSRISRELDDVRAVMEDSLSRALGRGERLDDVAARAAALAAGTGAFARGAGGLRRREERRAGWARVCAWGAVGTVVAVAVGGAVLAWRGGWAGVV
jgi:hypothetical protein